MILINKILLSCITCIAFTVAVSGQSGQRFNNSLRAQYGLYQYNSKQSDFITDDDRTFLSAGLTYRHQLGRVSGFNFTGRYYKWQTDDENDLNTYAAQAMYVLHPKRISNNWRVNRITPYLGLGLGAEKHIITNVITNDTSFFNLYIPAEAGILFNLSSRWSVGIFAEYKFAAAADIKKLTNNPTGKLDIVNAGGITLAYNFGKNKRMIKAPVVVTNIYEKPAITGTAKQSLEGPQLSTTQRQRDNIFDTIFQTKNNADYLIKTTSDTVSIIMFDSAKNLFRTPPGRYLMEPKDSIDTEILKANADLLNDFSNENLDLVDSFRTRRTYNVNNADQEPKNNNYYKVDSLIRIVNQLNNRINNIPAPPAPITIERKFIETEQPDLNDSPVITQLKDSYNRLGETAERNYKQGYINENTLQQIRNETEEVKRSIRNLSQENETGYNESDRIFAIIALMQRQQDAMRRNAVNNGTANNNEQRLQQEIDNLQFKLEKTLLELDGYKRPVPQTKVTQTSIDSLVNKQNDLEKKFQAIEERNLKMASMFQKINDATKTKAIPEPIITTNNIVGTIKFAINSEKIDNLSMVALKTLVSDLKDNSETILLLSGFADKTGSAAYNLALSKRRVQSVKNVLQALGYKKELIIERYFGSDKAAETQTVDDRKVVIRALRQ